MIQASPGIRDTDGVPQDLCLLSSPTPVAAPKSPLAAQKRHEARSPLAVCQEPCQQPLGFSLGSLGHTLGLLLPFPFER